jgi:hypothetical protein
MTTTILFVIGFAIICFLTGVIIYLERQLRDARQEIRATEVILKDIELKLKQKNSRIRQLLAMNPHSMVFTPDEGEK